MKVLLLGVGLMGKAALYDLVQSQDVTEILAADRDIDGLKQYLADKPYGTKVCAFQVDGTRIENIADLMARDIDVAIDLMPTFFKDNVAAAAVATNVHLVNPFYPTPEFERLSPEAAAKGLTILGEWGMDPGIDLLLLGEAARQFDELEQVVTYGAGFPEPSAADNPLQYKITWTFEGVLRSYYRAGRVIWDGELIEFGAADMFHPQYLHEVNIEGIGTLEAFPNGDALRYAEVLGLDLSKIRKLGRYVLRWPGHGAFWKKLADLHFLDEESLIVDGVPVDRRRFLVALIEPQLQYRAGERDVVVARIDLMGKIAGTRYRALYQCLDFRDLNTGFSAMARTVGFTASIGAQMIGTGKIRKRGLLSPLCDLPYDLVVHELGKRGISITSRLVPV